MGVFTQRAKGLHAISCVNRAFRTDPDMLTRGSLVNRTRRRPSGLWTPCHFKTGGILLWLNQNQFKLSKRKKKFVSFRRFINYPLGFQIEKRQDCCIAFQRTPNSHLRGLPENSPSLCRPRSRGTDMPPIPTTRQHGLGFWGQRSVENTTHWCLWVFARPERSALCSPCSARHLLQAFFWIFSKNWKKKQELHHFCAFFDIHAF